MRYGEGSHAIIHESDAMRGTPCNGCPSVEVLLRREHAREVERYWCGAFRGYVDPRSVECPRGRRG